MHKHKHKHKHKQMVQFEESVCSETERIYWHMMSTGSSAILRAIFLDCAQSCGRRWSATQRRAMRCLCPQVTCTLGFLATGAFQRELANRLGLCQSTLSRAVWDGIICISYVLIFVSKITANAQRVIYKYAWSCTRVCYPVCYPQIQISYL